MTEIEFDFDQLSKKEQLAYQAMNQKERSAFENKWIRIQELKEEMLDKIEKTTHRARQKEAREKIRQRKADTHRKIVNGSILEVYLPEELKALDEDNINQNTKLKEFFDYIFNTPYVKEEIKKIKAMSENDYLDLY